MILDINKVYNKIEQDFINNQTEIFNRYLYYNRKWSYLSNRLNDVNTSLILDDYYRPVVQIFIRNKTGYIRSRLIFNKEGNKVLDKEILNHKLN